MKGQVSRAVQTGVEYIGCMRDSFTPLTMAPTCMMFTLGAMGSTPTRVVNGFCN